MTTKTGKPYEKLTKQVFEAIHAHEGVTHICIKHDEKIPGRTTTHQIDVYWEFEVGGITYRTVVECKDWQVPVDQGVLLHLVGVLGDLQGQPRGVVVARNGFQEGAEQFAKAHGIVLYELRAPIESDWEGFITRLEIKGQFLGLKVHAAEFKCDEQWLRAEMQRCGILSTDALPRVSGLAGEMRFEREDGSLLMTMEDVLKRLVPAEVGVPEWREYMFDEPGFLATGWTQIPRVRLRGVRLQIEVIVADVQDIEVDLVALVGYILKEVTKGTVTMLDGQGRPLDSVKPRPARIKKVGSEEGST